MNDLVPSKNSSPLIIYGCVIILILLGFFLEILFFSQVGSKGIYFFLFPAIVISAWYGGFLPGLLTTLASSLIFLYLPFFRQQSITLSFTPDSIFSLALFIWEGLIISYVLNLLGQADLISQFKRKEKEQTKIIEDLREKLDLAKEEIKARDEFLSIASHELKTPLTSMLLQLQRMLHNIRNVSLANFSVENLLNMLENAESQTHRLSKMINDLLNVSLITTKKLDLEIEQMDLAALAKEVVENFSAKLEKDGQIIHLEAKDSVSGQWDKLRIEQVITNLISNAIKYGDKKPIEVKVTNHDDTGKIIVSDHGIGIPKAQQEKIFALFERATTSSKYKGLGVGLFITNQIVTAHHGKIHVESQENQGSIFTVELPIKKSVNT